MPIAKRNPFSPEEEDIVWSWLNTPALNNRPWSFDEFCEFITKGIYNKEELVNICKSQVNSMRPRVIETDDDGSEENLDFGVVYE